MGPSETVGEKELFLGILNISGGFLAAAFV
jgi:hypothetical protein